jgi:uncharacterized membrane protein
MRRLLHAILIGLVGAGIVHITVLLLVPQFSEQSAWSRLAATSGLYRMTALTAESGGAPVVRSVDPLFAAAACRFDLADGMAQVKGPAGQPAVALPFWSVSVYDGRGNNIYSFNDHGVSKGQLDAVVLTPAQMNEVRKDLPEEYQGSVFIEAPVTEGILVVRAFVPDESWRPIVSHFLEQSSCDVRQP